MKRTFGGGGGGGVAAETARATAAEAAKAQGFARTTVKTSAYTAAPGDWVPVDTTAGPVTITLPTAPADKSRIGIKHIVQGGTNAVTYATGGSDVINRAGGPTSGTLALLAQAVMLQYDAATAIYTIQADDLALSQLDARFATAAQGVDTRTPTDGSVTNAKVAAGAAIAESKLSLATDAAVGTGSRRTLGTGATQAYPGDSGATNAANIATNTTAIGTKLPLAGGTLTGALTLAADPASALQAATKQYVDAIAQGLSPKQSVVGASTTNHSVSAYSGTTIDGGSVSLTTGKRILLKDQTTPSENGLWIFNGAGSALTRPADFAVGAVEDGAFVFVESGTTNGASGWTLSGTGITVGTTAQTWVQFSGAGQITAGTALTKTGNTLAVSLGTGAAQAAAGNDSRLSDARTPTTGSVVDASVSASAAIAESKLSLASDAAAGTASRRTLGTGAAQAAAGNDSRLSDARVPTSHGSTHSRGGTDEIGATANEQRFTAAGTWTKPTGNFKFAHVTCIASGGGGGAGRRGAAASVRCGGGGGGGGGYSSTILSLADLPSTVSVLVGAAGTAGAAATADNTDGGAGGSGGTSAFGSYCAALGGTGGSGGTATSGTGGAIGFGMVFGGAGAAALAAGGAGTFPSVTQIPGGSSGGGVNASDSQSVGGIGRSSIMRSTSNTTGGTSGGGAGGDATNDLPNSPIPGTAGAGGGSSTSSAGGRGGNATYGAGGGGGGASLNGNNSGAGGTGGPGIVVVVCY